MGGAEICSKRNILSGTVHEYHKKEKISPIDTNMKCKKSWDAGGSNAYKIFMSRVEEGTFQAQYPMWNCSWIPWKWKIISAIDTSMKCKKSRDGGGNNAYKIIICRVEERNIICKRKTCLELFIATMKKKQFSELSKK